MGKSDPSLISVQCSDCGLSVHGSCYGCSFSPNRRLSSTPWKCRYCHAVSTGKVNGYHDAARKAIKCRICNQTVFGALKSCGKNMGFAHLVCALLTPFTYLENRYRMAPIRGIERCKAYKSALKKLRCSICNKSNASIKCRFRGCNTFYHPLCLMNKYRHCVIERDETIDTSHASKVYYIYCPRHVQSHQDFDCSKVRKQGKSREAFIKNDDYANIEDVTMSDNESDIIILNVTKSKKIKDTKNTKKRKFECESNVNVVTIESEEKEKRSDCNECILPSSDPFSVHSSNNFAFNSPAPSIQCDIASQWTERLMQNTSINDGNDSLNGFEHDTFHFPEYSPLNIMSPYFNDNNLHHDNFMFPSPGIPYNHYSNISNATNPKPIQMEIEVDSMRLVPSRSIISSSTNSTFATTPCSPKTVASHSTFTSLSTPKNNEVYCNKARFADVVEIEP